MTNRENALEIIHFGKPERIVEEAPEHVLAYLGCDHESFDGTDDNCPAGTRWRDIWGTGWHKEKAEYMGLPEICPLDEPEKLAFYKWPNPTDERICGRIYEQREKYDPADDVFLTAYHRDTLWEKAYMLVGMENMMTYFYTEPEYAREILGRIMDFQLGMAKVYLKNGVEVVRFSDDLGTQNSLLMSKDMITEFLVPEYRRLFEVYKKKNVIIEFHSCGCIGEIIEILINLGASVLNPIQANANNLAELRKKTDGRLCLRGGISTELIMAGDTAQIEADVKKKIALLGKNGGYFCCPDQRMPWKQKSHNAFTAALREWGAYPIRAALQ